MRICPVVSAISVLVLMELVDDGSSAAVSSILAMEATSSPAD